VTEPSIVVVEDDAELRDLVVRALREEGIAAEGLGTARALVRRLERRRADALVIDIGLPDADGRDLCQALRARGIDAPVLFLTARDAVPDRLAGFAAGGDDYLTKPFAVAELAARLHALLRRAGLPRAVTLDGLIVDPAAHAAVSGSRRVDLTPTEFRLLAMLAGAAPDTVRRRELMRAGWPQEAWVRENTLDSFVARVRRKLAGLPAAPRLETVHGVGYRLRS
jgi:two-component system response regulator MprA